MGTNSLAYEYQSISDDLIFFCSERQPLIGSEQPGLTSFTNYNNLPSGINTCSASHFILSGSIYFYHGLHYVLLNFNEWT